MGWFGNGKCGFCTTRIGRDEVPRYRKMAAGNVVKCCRGCDQCMGSSDLPNIVNQNAKRKDTRTANQMRLW